MKKIMFNDKFGLTKAVLDGRKTQTRRICKEQIWAHSDIVSAENRIYHFESPKYKVGEVVAVAQSYRDCGGFSESGKPRWEIIAASVGATNGGWNNKRFARASFMPHQILITDVRIEHLQDISEDGCIKEGVRKVVNENGMYVQYYVGEGDNACSFENPREAFAHLINKANRKDVWNENPYVFVYDFELIK